MEVLTIGSITPIILIYLKVAFAERCTVDSQLFPSPTSPPPPPEFPDFMTAFGGTLLRIGIENLWPQERESCPYSVNWSTFNSRLCGSDPFDLDSFCRTLSITSEPPTVVDAPTPTTPEKDRSSATTDVENRVHAITTTDNTLVRSTEKDHGFVLLGNTTSDPPFPSDVASTSDFPALPAIHPESIASQSPPPPPFQVSSLASPVDSSSFAASGALTGDDGDAGLAIGVTCGILVLVVCVIVFVILFSRHRWCKCRGVRRSVFMIFQRQKSDVQPLSSPSPSHPSTPLQAMYSNPMTTTTNNNVYAETSDVEANGISLTKRLDVFQSSIDHGVPDDGIVAAAQWRIS